MILLNERLKGIIRILKDTQDYITSKQLADQMDISVRTIKSTLKGLKMELTAYGAELEIKRGVGSVSSTHLDVYKRQGFA